MRSLSKEKMTVESDDHLRDFYSFLKFKKNVRLRKVAKVRTEFLYILYSVSLIPTTCITIV
jgi:hypothetical protein